MTTEKLLPHEELLIEISRTCRRLGVCTPMKEFINAAYDLLWNKEKDLPERCQTARGTLHALNPRSEEPDDWKLTHVKEEIDEECCAHACNTLRRMNDGEILWWSTTPDEIKEQYYKTHSASKMSDNG